MRTTISTFVVVILLTLVTQPSAARNVSNSEICKKALFNGLYWSEHSYYLPYVKEAKKRNLDPLKCAKITGSIPIEIAEAYVVSQSMSDAQLCERSTDGKGNWRENNQKNKVYIAQAKIRA